MNFDATFWVAVSFFLFVGVLLYFKVPQKIFITLDESINKIRKDIEEAEKLKEEAKNILSDYEARLDKSKVEIDLMIKNAQKESDANIIKTNDQFHKIFENRKKINEDIQTKKGQMEKDIQKETLGATKEIEKFKINSLNKVNIISEEIVSEIIQDIFKEDLNKSSIKATVSEVMKEKKN